jgi:tetratricopeptide (TPR) repeat protein
MKKIFIVLLLFAFLSFTALSQAAKIKTIMVSTSPDTTVWINDVKRGKTDATGKLAVRLTTGKNILRLRSMGFKEVSQAISPAQTGEIKVLLVKSTDEAELTFQKAEAEPDKEKSSALYEKAISLRPKYAEAYVGLARVLSNMSDAAGALDAIANARKIRPIYPEASAVEGRIHNADGEDDKAIAAFKRSIKEGNGIQPEAHTGLGLLYKGKAEGFSASSDFENETANYQIAAKELNIALQQLYGTEEVLYTLLGVIYEKLGQKTDAIRVYEDYLKLYPNSNEATTYRSYIVQLKKNN